MDHTQPVQLAQSKIYEIILSSVYAHYRQPITWPTNWKARIKYCLTVPHVALQHITIPNAMRPGKDNFYPLTFLMATVWIWIYCFVIVWFTYEITISFDLHFSILPMILYPFGIVLRDLKKMDDMRSTIKAFKIKYPDQRLGLAETFAGPVFQITGLMGLSWLMYISNNQNIKFINEGIQY